MAIGQRRKPHHTGRVCAGENSKRTSHKIIQREEKCLDARQHDAYVWHQLRMLVAINEKSEKCVGGKQPRPQKQRAFLAGPKSGELVIER